MTLPNLSNRNNRNTPVQQQQQQQQPMPDDEPHAFDLTWRNYVPSFSEFCCCYNRREGQIRLADDDDFSFVPFSYKDHSLYRGEAIHGYLTNSRENGIDSILAEHSGNSNLSQQSLATKPSGRRPSSSWKAKKKASTHSSSTLKKKRKGIYHQQQQQQSNSSSTETDTVLTADDDAGNTLNAVCYQDENADAVFLQDDLISNLVNQPEIKRTYYARLQPPTIEEMHVTAPFVSADECFDAARLPELTYTDDDTTVSGPSSTSYHANADAAAAPSLHSFKNEATKRTSFISIEAAQALLSDKLDDLTEKLTFIKENIMHIQKQPKSRQRRMDDGDRLKVNDDDDENFDRTTLHTMHRPDDSEIDSITSEALEIYADTDNDIRYNAANTLSTADTPTTATFDNQHDAFTTAPKITVRPIQNDSNQDLPGSQHSSGQLINAAQEGISVQTVLNIGRKWLGV